MKKRFLPFFQILLWSAIAVVIVAVIATGTLTNITLRSVEKNLPNQLLEQLHDLDHVLDNLRDVVSTAELTHAVTSLENVTQLRNKVKTVYKGIVELRNTYVFDNLIQASAFHAVVAPAIADVQIWLSEGVSGYGPQSATTIGIVRSRIFEAFLKAKALNNDSHLTAQKILNDQLYRLNRFLIGVNLLFILTLIISLIMVFLLIRQHVLQHREIQAQAQRKHAEESLRVSEQRFRQLAEATSEAVVIHDQGVIIEANDQYYKMFGYSADELTGIDAIALTATHDSANQMKTYIKSGYLGPYEATGKRKDGSTFPMEIRVKTMEISGKTIRMSAIRDLTSRKQYEEALRNSEEQLKSYLNSNPNPVVVYNLQGHPLYLNPAFTKVFGWTLEELHGEKISFVPPDQEHLTAEKVKTIIQTHKPVVFNTRRLTKNGDIRDILISAAEIKGPGKDPAGIVVNLVDISETKKLESQFQAAQRIESLGTLAGGIAHDFNNLLMGILGNVTLMLDEKLSSSEDYDKLKSIEHYVREGSHLTRQLLGFAKGGKYEVKPLNINDLIEKSSRMFGRTKKEIHIHQNYQKDIWIVEADPGQMEQVLLNLFVNAWQAMPGGGELYLETSNVNLDEDFSKPFKIKPGNYVKISVTDTGIGMDEPTRERIFDPFFTTKEMGRGTGLGLASVYGIVKNHNGIINVYSEKDKGTTFNIYLPASDKKITADQTLKQETLTGSGTILLVDDEKMIIKVNKKMLEKLGYEVISASNGEEALKLYHQNKDKIKIVILDMIMPDMDGGQVFDAIKHINPDVKTILSSGYSINGKAEEILKRGCEGFIQKPFNLNELSIKLNEVMEKPKR